MSVIDDIAAASRQARPHIVLSEGDDARVINAARRAAKDGLARVTLLGTTVPSSENVRVVDPETAPERDRYIDAYEDLRRHKGVSRAGATAAMAHPLGFAAMMVRLGDAQGMIGGAVHTTSDVVRTALQIIGRGEGVSVVSSYFLMLLGGERPVVFADCGLVLQPTAEELASIAIASSRSLTAMTGLEPRVAMLSFSTKGSVPAAAHESLGRIARAIEIVNAEAPDLLIDGELQFDAAIVPAIAARKAPTSPLKGAANVFVFPSLSAGNIGYKIAQRIGGATALGPILQGLAKPANDLSRGCSVEDVYQMIAITGAQAARQASAYSFSR
ncbi:MAG: phosphate acetyltransferase [Silicimonas sp.]|nr:phosphate acetyltransferase [Silicimonas sp.]